MTKSVTIPEKGDASIAVKVERWVNPMDYGFYSGDHHGYTDLFGNRCERITIAAGASRIVYEAEVLLTSPGDRIAPGTPETPIMALPDENVAFVMPSRTPNFTTLRRVARAATVAA